MTCLSIVIPTKNRPAHLERALLSLGKPGVAVEIIVVDDGSNAEIGRRNEEICRRISGCRYLRLQASRGASAARNSGFRVSGGAHVWFLDDDDYATPQTVQDVLRAALVRADACILLMPRMIVCDGTAIRLDVPINESDKWDRYSRFGIEVTTSCAVFPRSLLLRLRGWDETLPALQDTDLFLRAARIARFTCLETEPVRVDVGAPGRITNAFVRSQLGKLKFLRKHWRILPTGRRLLYLAQIAGCSPFWRMPRARRQLALARCGEGA